MFAVGQVGKYGFRIIGAVFLERKRCIWAASNQLPTGSVGLVNTLFFQAGKQLYADVLPVGIRFEQFFDLGQGFLSVRFG